MQCADELGLSFSEIETCSSSVEGEQLLHEVGLVTNSLVPEVNYVPWMVLDGVRHAVDCKMLNQTDSHEIPMPLFSSKCWYLSILKHRYENIYLFWTLLKISSFCLPTHSRDAYRKIF